ncbi:conserved membrane hypothetical protein [Pseudomonas sp. 8AS]|uniref:DUF805 domain-containing protein n=1 Tax=Pseudomonas sp. 8AS TaxID=2653163 RepID=UPI0012F2E1CD|nr:DUF805 domain-containing protein [Pseudomonas sp. 8AS]VXB52904.1 conserved membrane hypothetical protein [Pseudomonas sp. 8AS]
MTEARYKIVFTGELMPEAALDTVKDNLARLFKSDRQRIEALFSGAAVALKRDLAESEADKYLSALQQAGARVRKEPEASTNLSLLDTDDHRPAATAATDAPPDSDSMSCPKCGHEQAKAGECTACGIIIDKYLARQAQQAAMTAPASASLDASPYSTPKAQVAEPQPEFGELRVFSVTGRIGRVRYLGWSMAMAFAAMGVGLLAALGSAISPAIGIILVIALAIGAIVVGVQIGVQRLHDIGWSGWLLLLNLVPVVGGVFSLIMLLVPGTTAANRYGPPPPPNSTGVKLLAWSWLAVFVLGILAAIAVPSYQGYLERAQEAQLEQSAPDYQE